MKVKLPRSCIGQEVLEAFKEAVSFSKSATDRWVSEELAGEKLYVSGSVRVITKSMGARVSHYKFTKRWILFGRRVWRKSNFQSFVLNPVIPEEKYTIVDIDVMDVVGIDERSIDLTNCPDDYYKHTGLRGLFEKFLGDFFSRLQFE